MDLHELFCNFLNFSVPKVIKVLEIRSFTLVHGGHKYAFNFLNTTPFYHAESQKKLYRFGNINQKLNKILDFLKHNKEEETFSVAGSNCKIGLSF